MRLLPVWALWLGVGVGSAPLTMPVDGGRPLDFPPAAQDSQYEGQPCTRRERGGWHQSVVHCERMTPAKRLVGVWVTAFEENSFLPDQRSVPAPDDPRRFASGLEFDSELAVGLSGHRPKDPNGEAYLLTFIGRRTYDPSFDCYGRPSFTYVVDRLVSANYLGPVEPMKPSWWRTWKPLPWPRYSGRWGEMQAARIDRCRKRSALSR